VLPRGHLRWRGHEFLEQVNTVLSGYVRAQILSALFVGAVAAAGLAVLQVPYALLLGVAAGALEFVPLVGPASAALLAASLVRGGRLIAVLALLVSLRILQDFVVYPRLMRRRVHLPAVAVIVAVLFGALGGGILGVLVAVPLVAVGAMAVRQWRDYRDIEKLVAAAHASTSAPQS
jgi:predicted PurR-regulated permease PerM